jgi:propionyl-CoA synthetase
MNHLRSLFIAGEHCDRDTLEWIRKILGKRPVVNHYWQTETGTPITSISLGLEKHPVR